MQNTQKFLRLYILDAPELIFFATAKGMNGIAMLLGAALPACVIKICDG